jgi:hypothetical protein
MGQYLPRFKEAIDLERLWLDYVGELVHEAAANPYGDATIVAIGLHPFVVGTPAGAAAMRRILASLQKNDSSGSPTWNQRRRQPERCAEALRICFSKP